MRNQTDSAQLCLDIPHEPRFSRENLVVSLANAESVALIDSWPRWPSRVVILVGPEGAGKSHLASVWASVSFARRLNFQDISFHSLGKGPFIVENADSDILDQISMFHLINSVNEMNSHLLITARRLPAAWGVTLLDLSSRLKAASVIEIKEPDDQLLFSVIKKLFADRQLRVASNVVAYLVSRMERSLSEALTVVDALDRASLNRKTHITRSLASGIIDSLSKKSSESA